MKKVDDQELMEMLAKGIEQKKIAEHFGVNPSYITKRKKQLMPAAVIEEPETFSTLTDQQKKFVIAKVEGKTNIQAVTENYEVTSKDSAKALGSQMMQNPAIQQSIAELMDNEGLTKLNRIKQLKKLVYHNDGNISLKALDQTWKLDGSYSPEKHEYISDVEIRAIIASITIEPRKPAEAIDVKKEE